MGKNEITFSYVGPTLKPYGILTIKNLLLKSVYYITEYNINSHRVWFATHLIVRFFTEPAWVHVSYCNMPYYRIRDIHGSSNLDHIPLPGDDL
jgi:hypothetical protein